MTIDTSFFVKEVWTQEGKDEFKMSRALGDIISFFSISCERE